MDAPYPASPRLFDPSLDHRNHRAIETASESVSLICQRSVQRAFAIGWRQPRHAIRALQMSHLRGEMDRSSRYIRVSRDSHRAHAPALRLGVTARRGCNDHVGACVIGGASYKYTDGSPASPFLQFLQRNTQYALLTTVCLEQMRLGARQLVCLSCLVSAVLARPMPSVHPYRYSREASCRNSPEFRTEVPVSERKPQVVVHTTPPHYGLCQSYFCDHRNSCGRLTRVYPRALDPIVIDFQKDEKLGFGETPIVMHEATPALHR